MFPVPVGNITSSLHGDFNAHVGSGINVDANYWSGVEYMGPHGCRVANDACRELLFFLSLNVIHGLRSGLYVGRLGVFQSL